MTEDSADIHDELVQEFYGIDPGTLKVDNVAITRSGKLSQWTDRGYQIHQLQGGRRPGGFNFHPASPSIIYPQLHFSVGVGARRISGCT